jgi:hypothetical protein
MTVREIFGEALALVNAPAAAVTTGGPSPISNSAREVLVWWVIDASSGGNGG